MSVLHAEAVAFNNDDLAVVNYPIEYCTCNGIVIVENHGPLFESPVGREECGTPLVARGYNLEEQIGSLLIDWNVA